MTTNIIHLLRFEEGWREKPYVDTLGYPTVGFGFLLGPKIHGTQAQREAKCQELYTFRLPLDAGEVWLTSIVRSTIEDMKATPSIKAALDSCLAADKRALWNNPRAAVLVSMAHQMGVDGLAGFRNTLLRIQNQEWWMAETGMLKSKWANQTPNRARRHALQMKTGEWAAEYS